MRSKADLIRLFDFEPDLLCAIPAEERHHAAERIVLETLAFSQGPLDLGEAGSPDRAIGMLVLDGLVLHRHRVFGRSAVALLGAGDLLRPLQGPPLTSCEAASDVRVALLGHRFQREVARWPGLVASLVDRVDARAAALGAQLAIVQMPSLERRLLALLWSLAHRWGTVVSGGVALYLPVGQGVLADVVGAQRTSVSSALRRLRDRGLVVQQASGRWLLLGGCPDELRGDAPAADSCRPPDTTAAATGA